MIKTITRNTYLKTSKEFVDAIQWNGKNVEEIRNFVPNNLINFSIDRITQTTQIEIVNYKQRKSYSASPSDYIVKLAEDSFIIMDRFKFEETYTDYDIIKKQSEEEKEKTFFKIDVVKAIKVDGGYNVKEHTGFVKFVSDADFEKQYRDVDEFFGAPIK